jgi:hypothetical protein
VKLYPGRHSQTVGEVGDPPLHVKLASGPELSLLHPYSKPSSQTSVPTTNPSLRIATQFDPEAWKPVKQAHVDASVVDPPEQEYP